LQSKKGRIEALNGGLLVIEIGEPRLEGIKRQRRYSNRACQNLLQTRRELADPGKGRRRDKSRQ
jgi:hypothetical protein